MRTKLGDVCASIYDGDHSAPPKSESGIPFITISNIDTNDGFIDFLNTAFVSEEYYMSLKTERKPRRDDVLYSVVGSFGIPSLVKNDGEFVFQRHIAILRPSERIDSTYLYYVLKNPSFYHWADAVAIGSAQRTVTLGQLRNKEIDLPDLDAQHRIAGVLSAYDELIENNCRQIKLLEEAAQRLYKEWFIDLKFPGHETTPIHSGLPEGWRRTTIGVVAEINASSVGRAELPKIITYVDLSSVSRGRVLSATRRRREDAPSRARRIAKEGSIAWGMVRPAQRSYALIRRPSKDTVLSTGFAVIDAKAVPFSFLFEELSSEDFIGYLIGLTNGSTYPAVKPEHFSNRPIVVPAPDLLRAFDSKVLPLLDQVDALSEQIAAAREARDRLLPKLMSGEIEV